jgi:hypothetical protein
VKERLLIGTSIAKALITEFGYTSNVKCIECNQRKGKRLCPARHSEICPKCCGEKRVREIPCPPECPYLATGQNHHMTRKYQSLLGSEQSVQRRMKLLNALEHNAPLVSQIEREIAQFAAGVRSLGDIEVREAIRQLRETYRTESKGLIYEHSSAQPLVQALFREIRVSLEKLREEVAKEGAILRVSDVLDSLDLMEADVSYYLGLDSGGKGYLNFVARNHPEISGSSSENLIVGV